MCVVTAWNDTDIYHYVSTDDMNYNSQGKVRGK